MLRRLLIALLVLSAAIPARAEGLPSLLMLTLDDRPVNTLFVQQLAAIAGINLELTTDPARAGAADLVSLNAAAFGSLVASRSGDPSYLTPPILKSQALVHFAVPRVQPFVKDEESLAAYAKALNSLSDMSIQELVRAAIAGEGYDLGDPALADYARRMRAWLWYLERAQLPPDRLLITLDDNRPGPLSAWLKLRLREFSHHVHDGTDEGMMLLLARWCREQQSGRIPPELGVLWTHPADPLTLQSFESATPMENVIRMADWLRLRVTPALKVVAPWRPVLWLHGGNGDVSAVTAQTEAVGDHPVIVADYAQLNRGDSTLFEAWQESGVPAGLKGYVGWNTASNTLGTAIALWAAVDYGYSERSDPESVAEGVELFLWARLLDDWLYMAEVRPGLQEQMRAEGRPTQGMSPAEAAQAVREIQSALMARWQDIGPSLRVPFRWARPGAYTAADITIPWGRLFEIGVVPVDPRGFLPVVRPAPLDPAPR